MKGQSIYIKVFLVLGLVFALSAETGKVGKGLLGSKGQGGMVLTVPGKINFQGYLTDNVGNPLNGTFGMTFKIYNAPSGGSLLWTESQTVSVNDGIFDVLLGSSTPIPGSVFTGSNRYLEVKVEAEVLSPRVDIASVAYAYRSIYSDTASYAQVSSVACPLTLTCSSNDAILTLRNNGYGPGLVIDNSGYYGIIVDSSGGGASGISINYADWQGVWNGYANAYGFVSYESNYGGFATNSTPGYGFYAIDVGSHGLYVQNAGEMGAYVYRAQDGFYVDSTTGSPYDHGNGFWVRKANNFGVLIDTSLGNNGVYVRDAGYHGFSVAHAAQSGLWASADNNGVYIAYAGNYGVNVSYAQSDGIYIYSAGDDGVTVGYPDSVGMQIYNPGSYGIRIWQTGNDAIHIDSATSEGVWANSKTWDGGHFETSASAGYGLYVKSYQGDPNYTGIYCQGKIIATGTKSSVVKTSHGDVLFYAIETPDVEFMTSGKATLHNGEATVTFEKDFSEAISPDVPLKITATPEGSWSGLYVVSSSNDGFTIRSGAGDQEAEFTWVAIGRRVGYEARPTEAYPEGRKEHETLYRERDHEATINYAKKIENDRKKQGEMAKASKPEAAPSTYKHEVPSPVKINPANLLPTKNSAPQKQ